MCKKTCRTQCCQCCCYGKKINSEKLKKHESNNAVILMRKNNHSRDSTKTIDNEGITKQKKNTKSSFAPPQNQPKNVIPYPLQRINQHYQPSGFRHLNPRQMPHQGNQMRTYFPGQRKLHNLTPNRYSHNVNMNINAYDVGGSLPGNDPFEGNQNQSLNLQQFDDVSRNMNMGDSYMNYENSMMFYQPSGISGDFINSNVDPFSRRTLNNNDNDELPIYEIEIIKKNNRL
jgi:hypothetical protein